jgi:hypothetical protein
MNQFKSISLLFILSISLFLNSCGGDPISQPETASGSYSVSITNPDCFRNNICTSYVDGGGVFIFELNPGNDFSGMVNLEVEADPKLGTKLSYPYIDRRLRISEISIHPTAGIDTGNHTIILNMYHNNKHKEIFITIYLMNYNRYIIHEEYFSFVKHIENYYPQYTIKANDIWQKYTNCIKVVCFGQSEYLNDRYQIIFYQICFPDASIVFKIRRRNFETLPSLILLKEKDGTIHRE